MSLLYCDSFDHYTTVLQKWSSSVGTNTISTAAVRTGINGLNSLQNSYVRKNVATTVTGIIGAAVNLTAGGSQPGPITIMRFVDGGTIQTSLVVDNTGHLLLFRGDQVTLLATSTNPINFGAWNYIEFKTTVDPSAGFVEVVVNGISFASASGANTRNSSNSSFGAFDIGYASNSAMLTLAYFDDVYLINTSGSFNNTYLGNTAIKCTLPSGNGTTNQWAIGGSAPAATNWQSVNENPPDDGVTFVADSTVGQIDRYTFPAITGATVSAVVVNLRAAEDVSGTRSIRAAVKSGSTVADNGSDFALNTSYTDFQGIFETDPNTSAPWTVAAVNAAEFGEKVSV